MLALAERITSRWAIVKFVKRPVALVTIVIVAQYPLWLISSTCDSH
jgi:hypothetical protein